MIACQMCGGAVEVAVAGGGITLFAYLISRIANAYQDWRARRWLKKHTPSNAELLEWAKESEPPAGLADVEEERPW